MLCKKNYGAQGGRERWNFDILKIYSNKLAYLQLITLLVYENSPPKSHEQQDYLKF